MTKVELHFHADPTKVAAFDAIAAQMTCARDELLDKAMDAYLSLHAWQCEEIKKSVAEADAGEFVGEEEVEALFKRLMS